MSELPEYYFRIRENGAAVFRVDTENRQRRIEMQEIAVVNIRNGNVKPHGEHVLTDEEQTVIAEWMEERRAVLADRDIDDIHRAVDYLNLTTHWAQSRASDEDLEDVTDRLLLAMHDLRSVLVRKKADRLMKGSGGGAATG
ncbi:hypothetical protein GTA62_00495 [Roseobacter sp. HKCCD9010]|uniref:hypothetical protein n=1 Tax=unclassified Roseobacter TaxID=196798 RepID=UPI001491ACF6|nr:MULTISPECIES: hypothetical protein [unclassified Roseobacter]MBF9049659.1 hypothetical protein [Rhodobacterales bacterium HKCCD4356]NNV11659.1 hypothetical protein [Roseobacter sp. HKCCD7357]NNV15843.1 hypothetical protein [Roseobacter sp. HKCCD8768]NNV25303.1 hypothetical protein [Roseobacter sp. HKCCD8192]NNV29560.1 hypothetical protein [Roseobacter sp. HKCCD9061]